MSLPRLIAAEHRHPVNIAHYDHAPLGARVADHVVGFLGSWTFLILQSVIVLLWLAGNVYLLSRPFDPYPFILLNLAFSTQAAYAAPLILLAGNRSASRDRATLEHAARVEDEASAKLDAIAARLTALEGKVGG